MTALRVFVGGIALLAIAGTAAVLSGAAGEPTLVLSAPVLVLATCAIVAGSFPVTILRRDGNEDVEASHAFILALLLVAGPATALAAQVVAMFVMSLVRRRALLKVVFNVSQMAVAAVAAGVVMAALVPIPPLVAGGSLTPAAGLAFLLAALVYQLVNELAVSAVCARAEGRRVLRFMASEFRLTGYNLAVSAMAPLAAAAAVVAAWLVPLLLAPLLGFRRSSQAAVDSFEQSRRDALTGLPNAAALRELLSEVTAHRPTAIAMLDLDGFKEVNDTLGHDMGDVVLRAVADRLAALTAGHGRVFRMQGDEFVTLLDTTSPEEALRYADRLASAFHEPFADGGLELEIGLTAGIAIAAPGDCGPEELLRRADVAMYRAKLTRSGAVLYSAGAEGADRARQAISADLRRALASGEMGVHYQPQVSLRTGRVLSVEALVRWRRADGTMVAPGEFIPQAEHTGVILPLTMHVLRTSLADCRRWSDEHGYEGRVGINLSARTLHHAGLVDDIRAAIAESGLTPGRLEVEITESALMADPDGARRTLAALHDLGVDVLIDDFGTGYSSLAYLGTLPVDGVKIDRSFVAGMARERTDAVIVRSTLDLGHNLGLRVIAEGVEDAATRDVLVDLGCDLAQGWLWAAALPAGELGAKLLAPATAPLAA